MTSVGIWAGNVKRTWQYIHNHSSSSSLHTTTNSSSSSTTSTAQPAYHDLSIDISNSSKNSHKNTNTSLSLPLSDNLHTSKHAIILYHDTVTGTRSLAVDFEEVPESLGISSTLLGVNQVIRDTTNTPTSHSGGKGEHILPFTINVGAYRRRTSRDNDTLQATDKTNSSNINTVNGYVKIKKKNFFSFEYSCYVENKRIKEITQQGKSTAISSLNNNNNNNDTSQNGISGGLDLDATDGFLVEVDNYITVYDKKENLVIFYPIKVTRKSDQATTIVHRRFQEFDQLYHQIDDSFKGNHLRSSIPKLPEKKIKLFVEHVNDADFLQERQEKLDIFLKTLLNVPHVTNMDNVQMFLGFYNSIREFSVVFKTPVNDITVGYHSDIFSRDSDEKMKQNDPHDNMIIVTGIKNQKLKEENGLKVGDNISRICGENIPDTPEGLAKLQKKLTNLGRSDRNGKILLHFLQAV